MTSFIDEHRDAYGVEPICRVLPIAPSIYHKRLAQRRDPSRLSARAQRDKVLKPEIVRVFAENFAVYGVRKVRRQMRREGYDIARCTVERLIRDIGLAGVIWGKPVRTTISYKATPCPLDHANRQFYAPGPNKLWVSDFNLCRNMRGLRLRGLCHRYLRPPDRGLGGQQDSACQLCSGCAGTGDPPEGAMAAVRVNRIATLEWFE
jgi:putative transposase